MKRTEVLEKLQASQGDLFYENLDNGFLAEFTVFFVEKKKRIKVKVLLNEDVLGETVVYEPEHALAFVEKYEDEGIINSLPYCRLFGYKIVSISLSPQQDYTLHLDNGSKVTFNIADLRMLAIKGEVTVSIWYITEHNFLYKLENSQYLRYCEELRYNKTDF